MRIIILLLAASILLNGCGQEATEQERIKDFYLVENIEFPEGLMPEVGGMDFLPNGKLVVVFHRGEVMFYDPEQDSWELFAEGLHDPLGVRAMSNQELVVMQRPELTRLVDTDNDQQADQYITITDDFGMSGNYHEFAFGPTIDQEGNFFISLNCASSGDGIWEEVRGDFNPLGRPGRMYSCVPYRGWVLKVDQNTGEVTPWALGFRSPDGITFDGNGNLFVTDNQGDWLGTSKLFHVERDKFYGHVSSLVWKPGWDQDPLQMPVDTLDELRETAAVLFPHNLMANSPTEPILIPDQVNFGPFKGQMLVGEMNAPRLMRIMLEEVKGKMQGACVTFLDSAVVTNGNHRLVFGPQGDLWIGSTAYVWAGNKGIQRIRFQGGTPMDIQEINVQPDGFKLQFTRPVDPELAKNLNNYSVRKYYYKYHRKYGSPRIDEQEVGVNKVQVAADGNSLELQLNEMTPGYVYDITLDSLNSDNGIHLKNNRVFYTLNQVPD